MESKHEAVIDGKESKRGIKRAPWRTGSRIHKQVPDH